MYMNLHAVHYFQNADDQYIHRNLKHVAKEGGDLVSWINVLKLTNDADFSVLIYENRQSEKIGSVVGRLIKLLIKKDHEPDCDCK